MSTTGMLVDVHIQFILNYDIFNGGCRQLVLR